MDAEVPSKPEGEVMIVHRAKPNESLRERILRKAEDIRAAFIETGLVFSPDPECPFAELPAKRQEKWILLAERYCDLFPR